MLIQCFCQNRENIVDATTMLANQFKQSIKFFEVAIVKNIDGNPDRLVAKELLSDALIEVDAHFDVANDTCGVYYNEGEKVYIKVFKNAKNYKA